MADRMSNTVTGDAQIPVLHWASADVGLVNGR